MQQVQSPNFPHSYNFADFSVFPDLQRVEVNGVKLEFEPLIFDLLIYFLKNDERIVSRQELVDEVWKQGFVDDNAINRAISTLRKSLSSTELTKPVIKTHYKKGYSFEPTVIPVWKTSTDTVTAQTEHSADPNNSAEESATTISPNDENLARKIPLKQFKLISALLLLTVLIYLLYVFLPLTSHDSSEVVFDSSQKTTTRLANAKTSDMLFTKGLALFPIVSPNQRFVAYSYRPEGKSDLNIFIKDMNSGTNRVVVEHDYESFPVAIDNKGNLVYRLLKMIDGSINCELWLKPFSATSETSNHNKLFNCEGNQTIRGQLLNNANTLIYSKTNYRGKITRTAIFSRDLVTQDEYQISSPSITGNGDQYPAVSPNKSQVAFYRDSGTSSALYLSDIEGSNQASLLELDYVVSSIVWNKDGTQISWLNIKNWEVNTLDLTTKNLDVVKLDLDNKVNPYISITMLSKSRFVFASKYLDHDIVSVNFSDTDATLTPLLNSFSDEMLYIPLNDEGRGVYLESNNKYQIWLKDGSKRKKVRDISAENKVSLALSPSKDAFLVTTSNTITIYNSNSLDIAGEFTFENKIKSVDWLNNDTLIFLNDDDGVFKPSLYSIKDRTTSLFKDMKAKRLSLAGNKYIAIEDLNSKLLILDFAGNLQFSIPLENSEGTTWVANSESLFFKKNITQLWQQSFTSSESKLVFDFGAVGVLVLQMHPNNESVIVTTSKFSGNTLFNVNIE
ncbi:winged helix-turn-helix domain-containing protein [Glaciecola sp. 2405UD65-10]|uniref:winged helix-turn-helix domain-containing protein n=1 Tax=Glaciecola sp. 2405UD65-10 TaxID=3397244 RepID=UPI003B5948A8